MVGLHLPHYRLLSQKCNILPCLVILPFKTSASLVYFASLNPGWLVNELKNFQPMLYFFYIMFTVREK